MVPGTSTVTHHEEIFILFEATEDRIRFLEAYSLKDPAFRQYVRTQGEYEKTNVPDSDKKALIVRVFSRCMPTLNDLFGCRMPRREDCPNRCFLAITQERYPNGLPALGGMYHRRLDAERVDGCSVYETCLRRPFHDREFDLRVLNWD